MARAYESHGIHQGSDVSRLAEHIAEMERANVDKGGKPGEIIRKYQTNPPADLPQARLAAFLANGIVQAETDAAKNEQALKGYNPAQPTVLAQKEQAMQGVAGLPVREGMYSPDIYAQGGIGSMPEEEQPTYGVASGGLIAFSKGSPGEKKEEDPDTRAAEEKAARAIRGDGESSTMEQLALLLGLGGAGAAAATAGSRAAPAAVAPAAAAPVVAPAAAPAAGIAAGAPAAAPVTPSGIATPPAAAKPAGMGVTRAVINTAGKMALPAAVAAYVGDALKDTSGARFLQDMVTPVSPEEHDVNLSLGRATSPETANIVWGALKGRESNGKQFDKSGKPLTSPKGATGIAQVMPTTGPEAAKLAGLEWDENKYKNDATYNEAIGKAYFDKQLKDSNGDVAQALARYNAGPGVVSDFLNGTNKSGKNPNKVTTPNGIPPYPETQKYIANIEGRINTYLGDKARVAPDKPGVVRAVEMAKNVAPKILGGTGGAAQRFRDELGDDPLRGASLAGLKALIPAAVDTAQGVRDAVMPPKSATATAPALAVTTDPAGEAAAKQYEIIQERAAALAAKKDKSAQDIQDQKDFGTALMHMGATMMASKNPFFLGSLGEGMNAGLAGNIAATGRREDRDTKRAAQQETARSHRATEANNRFQAHLKALAEEEKRKLPGLDQQGAEEKSFPAAIRRLSTADRAVMGFDENFMQQYSTAAPAAAKVDPRYTITKVGG